MITLMWNSDKAELGEVKQVYEHFKLILRVNRDKSDEELKHIVEQIARNYKEDI